MGIEPIANSLSPVESVGLTLLEDRIGAGKRGILRPSCAQIYPSPNILGDGSEVKKLRPCGRHWTHFRVTGVDASCVSSQIIPRRGSA